MTFYEIAYGFHDVGIKYATELVKQKSDAKFSYTFENFFHPYVGELIARLNRHSLPGVMDAKWQKDLEKKFFDDLYHPTKDLLTETESFPKEIDVSTNGPYANYNWELFFHIPLTIAVHLSKNQRFAEAQRWFHYIFDPTSHDLTIDRKKQAWKFLAFRKEGANPTIEEIVQILSTPRSALSSADQNNQDKIMAGYTAILNKPFQPHVVARTRPLAYQYSVVMKYLDNLIAWGDHLFQQDTLETINEATQIYVLAANILGERPQRIPARGTVKAKTFAQLKAQGLGSIGNGFVELQGQIPFNLAAPMSGTGGGGDSNALFGIGRTLYFCVPRNEKMLSYWDTVADRLFKIRHCMNIAGVVRPLALFDPPLDPGMLVKAAAAGIDISSIVNGLNQPVSPVRCQVLIQKALRLCGEVRSLGNALLSAIEKGESERLALIRQSHEIKIQQMTQEVRFLQWKQAQETTASLLTSRKSALERMRYYQRVFGLSSDPNVSDDITLDRSVLNESNFDETYSKLVGQYEKAIATQPLPKLEIAKDSSSNGLSNPLGVFGGSGSGRLYLNSNEDTELNSHLPRARDTGLLASASHTLAGSFVAIPDAKANLHFWGLGGTVDIKAGTALVSLAKFVGDALGIVSAWERDQAGMVSRTASYQRRADDWILQYNLAAHDLMQNGRQILTSLIAEQIAYHEYLNIQKQIENANEVKDFLQGKFTNEELYLWMQGETSRLYYEYYRFAFETARKAERTMKQELMRPEVDAQDFIKFNYWDGGRKGLLSGEALYLDIERMDMAYLENNKRELELTKHVSLRQLDPLALLTLKATGTCQVTIPEWLYDLDCPGHYMRRIKSVALSIPSVVGPYTNVNCTLSLLKSSLRKSPILSDGEYLRQGTEDTRFMDYTGAVQSVVTSSGQNDSGLFETNLRDERFLPFEGAGAESTWQLDLPKDYRAFDYASISDVILHVRYTSRQGVVATKVTSALKELFQETTKSTFALLLNLRHDFPTEWSAFANDENTTELNVILRRNHFPYFTQGKKLAISELVLYSGQAQTKPSNNPDVSDLSNDLNGTEVSSNLVLSRDDKVLNRKAKEVFLILRYSLE